MARNGAHVWPDFLASDLQLLSCRPAHAYIQDRTSRPGKEYHSVPWCFLATVLPVDAYTENARPQGTLITIYPLTPARLSWGLIKIRGNSAGKHRLTPASISVGTRPRRAA
ncbi:hypothetical protein L209DRAFT_801429 [Thermothelomyces heterothallicus CBS 203.75]